MEEVSYPVVTDIRVNWHWIRPIIEDILEDSPQFTYIPEDVYAACKSGDAHCWVHDGGFLISKFDLDPFTGGRTFFVWVAGAKDIGKDFGTKFVEFFKQAAAQNGCNKMQASTGVSEIEKHFIHTGWKKDHVVFTQSLENEE
jgi:hypothetical protein